MRSIVPLQRAQDETLFGAKAVGLGAATRAGLPVPAGLALTGAVVDDVAAGNARAIRQLSRQLRALGEGPLAVRSSCVDEDGMQASFAGQHLTVLNVPGADRVPDAVREVWWSANSDSAITYRQRVGAVRRPSVGVVVQQLLRPHVAGVMFTRNPVTGADERVIEASWGLGEAVVAATVIPDHFRVHRSGEVLDRTAGVKKLAIRATPGGGTVEEEVPADDVERLCLTDAQLGQLNELAERCEQVYGPGRDIEWAFADGELYLLQCRAITSVGASTSSAPTPLAIVDVLPRVPLFADLERREVERIAKLFKERTFAAGETVTKEGAGGAAFFVIGSGAATVSQRGLVVGQLAAGDYFGEIALIDEGARLATVTATSELVCYGITVWDFRPLVQRNPTLAWQLLRTMAKRLRDAQESTG